MPSVKTILPSVKTIPMPPTYSRTVGNTACDVLQGGPCSCGGWHDGADADQCRLNGGGRDDADVTVGELEQRASTRAKRLTELSEERKYGAYAAARTPRYVDMTGWRVGKPPHQLLVLRVAGYRPSGAHRHLWWLVRCHCGKEFEARGSQIRNENTHSCGCNCRRGQLIDMTGKHTGRLHVIRRATEEEALGANNASWLCECRCGTQKVVRSDALRSTGRTNCVLCTANRRTYEREKKQTQRRKLTPEQRREKWRRQKRQQTAARVESVCAVAV